jgi:outer membrane protein assembly factor BamB
VYDAASGEELRRLEGAGGYHMLADASTGRVYSGAGANTRAHDPASGEELWRTRRPLSRQPAVVGDALVKVTDGTFVRYDGATGEVTEVTAGNVGGPTVGAAGIAVAIDSNASMLYGFDPEAGSVAWTTEITDPGFTAPTTVGSQVVIPAGEGLVGVNASSGEVTGETSVQGLSSPGLVGGESQVYRVFGDAGEAVVVGYSTPATE